MQITVKHSLQTNLSKAEYKYLLVQIAQRILLAPNALYSAKDIAKPMLKAAIDNRFVDSVCNQLRNKGANVPTGDDIFYHLAGKELTITSVFACMDFMLRRGLVRARGYVNLSIPLCIAIDTHDIPFYGEGGGELARWVIGCENKRGTNKCFRFITASIVVRGKRFTIAAIPVSVFDTYPELLERIISKTRQLIRIRYAFLDRWFCNVDSITKLQELVVSFVTPIVKRKGKGDRDILRLMRDSYYDGDGRLRYTMGTKESNAAFTVVTMMGKEDVIGFATNTKLRAETIGDWYSRRWGIETGYRVKNEFQPKTCARKSFAVRLLFNMFPFVLYNIWVFVNIELRVVAGKGRYLRNDRSYMTAYELCMEFVEFIADG